MIRRFSGVARETACRDKQAYIRVPQQRHEARVTVRCDPVCAALHPHLTQRPIDAQSVYMCDDVDSLVRSR
jgi:transcriptional antiterminator Rof (Rho-off)